MRTSQQPNSEAGFTLVETLVALMVLALMAGMVLFAAPGPERQMQTFAMRFAAIVARGAEESVTTSRSIALVLDDRGFGFARREEQGWIAVAPGGPLSFRAWPEGVQVSVEGESGADGRVTVFDTLGNATPAQIRLTKADISWRVSVNGEGSIDVARAP
jgi:general secretion pathway protein H